MTIRAEFEEMRRELKRWNKKDDTIPYKFHIEHHTKKAQKMMWEHVNRFFTEMNIDAKLGLMTTEEFNLKWKMFNDMSRSVSGMEII